MARKPKADAAKTANARRQAEYRRRHLQDPDGIMSARLNMVVPVPAAAKLKRLAAHYGVTQIRILEIALRDMEHATLAAMNRAQEREYLDRDVTA